MKNLCPRSVLAVIALMFCAFPIASQPGSVAFNKSTQDQLEKIMKADDAQAMTRWAANNQQYLNGIGPDAVCPLESAIKNSAPGCFAALLDAGADPNQRMADPANSFVDMHTLCLCFQCG